MQIKYDPKQIVLIEANIKSITIDEKGEATYEVYIPAVCDTQYICERDIVGVEQEFIDGRKIRSTDKGSE